MLKNIQNQLNLIYLNTDEHTHLDRYTGNTDILDMAFSSLNLSKHDIQFLIGDYLGSDHLPIEIAIDTPPHRNIHINPVRYKFNQPNIIQQDIHPDIRSAGNSPAEYSAGTYFYLYKRKSRIMVKMTPIQHNGIPKASKISN